MLVNCRRACHTWRRRDHIVCIGRTHANGVLVHLKLKLLAVVAPFFIQLTAEHEYK